MDVWGPAKTKSRYGSLYYLGITYAYSKFTWFFPLKRKSKGLEVFTHFKKMIELQLSCKIKQVQLDWEREFRTLIVLLKEYGIIIISHALTHTTRMGLMKGDTGTYVNQA